MQNRWKLGKVEACRRKLRGKDRVSEAKRVEGLVLTGFSEVSSLFFALFPPNRRTVK